MKNIKVTYQSTVRRFIVPDDINWSDLVSKIHELFFLPPTFKFSLSYTDDEGDIVTLSTDMELQDLLSFESTLKFVLTPDKDQPFVVNTSSDNNSENEFVTVEEEKVISDNVSVKVDKHVTIVDAADEPSFKPTIPSISKSKQKEESSAESSTFATDKQQQEEQHSSNNNEQQAPFIELAEQFQGLIDQFKDVISKNPQLFEQANTIMEQILQNIPVDFDQWAQWLKACQSGDTPTTNAQGDESNNSQGEQQRQQQQGGFCQFPPLLPPILSNPLIQRIFQETGAAGGFGNFENFVRPMGFNGPWNFNGQQQQQQRKELSQEALKEKINTLHSMGFWDDDVKNEDLLKKYNGNIDQVVEILINERIYDNSMESVDG